MKTIDNYINERLNPRHLGSTNKFPIDIDIKGIVRFLKNQGFEEINFNDSKTQVDTFDTACKRCYMLRDSNWLYFADTSNESISEDNPLFVIDDRYYNYLCRVRRRNYIGITSNETIHNYGTDKNSFLKVINKHFNWR